MDAKQRQALQNATRLKQRITIQYAKPADGKKPGGIVTRSIRPHEMSVNRAGRAVIWGTDSIHGARQIHAFREDRVVGVQESKRPSTFTPAKSVTKHLVSFGKPAPHPTKPKK